MRITFFLAIILSSAFAALPSITDTIDFREWIVCGPFSSGPREGLSGAVEDPLTFAPRAGDTFRTSLVQGGITVARRIAADSTGWLETNYQDVLWDSIQDYYGNTGLFCAGFAYAEFDCPKAGRALAVAPRLGGFVLNGRSCVGDVYGNGWFTAPVELDSGPNRVLLRLSGYGDQRARFALVPAAHDVLPIAADATVPDLVAGSPLTAWAGIPLLNTTASRLDGVRLRVLDSDSILAETTVNNLPAFGAKKVPLRLPLPAAARDSTSPVLKLVCQAIAGPDTATDTIRIAVRTMAEPVRQTFLSAIDNSCQYYAVRYPSGYDPARRYPVIFTLHGAGVEAWGQANAYRQKDWAFVVAPTNRRPYGFDWQDWGRLDGVEVLDTILARLPIDPDRVLLTGGSMGGHGDWHLSTTHPDRFAVVAPQASWPTHQLYVPWFLQRSAIFAEPGQLAIRDKVLRSDNVPAMMTNLANLPAFILHGGVDDNVPTLHGRNFAAWLDELGYDYRYREVPGRKHWWNYESLGVTVCDDPELLDYIRDKQRVAGPRHVRFRTADLGTTSKAYWVSIDRVRTVGNDAEVEAWATDSEIHVHTSNVAQFSLSLDERLFFPVGVVVRVDDQPVGKVPSLPYHLTLRFDRGRWLMGPARAPALAKQPSVYGPCRQAMMKPFLLVYGTQDTGLARFLRHSATQEGLRWWLIGNGQAEVLPDTAVSDSLAAEFNLVLYGGPAENRLTRRLSSGLPLQVQDGRLRLFNTDLGDSLASMFVYPNPLNSEKLVLVRMGTDAEHVRLSGFWGLASSSTGIPDFMVFDKSVRRYGWAGVRAAGFFGPDWRFDPASAFLSK